MEEKKRSRPICRLLATVTAAVLLVFAAGVPTLTAFADPEPKTAFLSAAAKLDKTANYAVAKAAADLASDAYLLLSGEELTDPSVIEAKTALDGEKERLSALAARADAFLSFVASLADATDVLQKREILDLAEEKEMTDESYPGIAAALAIYRETKEKTDTAINASEAYLDAIDKATGDFDAGEGYRTVKANYDLARAYVKNIDTSYPGILSAIGAEKALEAALLEIKQTNDTFLDSVKRLLAAKTYSECEERIAAAERNLEEVEDFDYDGMSEAIAAIDDAKADLAVRMAGAIEYISLVTAVTAAAGDEIIAAYAAAREAEVNTDLTVNSANAAKNSLDRFAAEYDDTAAAANGVMNFWLGVAIAK